MPVFWTVLRDVPPSATFSKGLLGLRISLKLITLAGLRPPDLDLLALARPGASLLDGGCL